jgi:hypothetical protein
MVGKFDSRLAARLYPLSLDGFPDDCTGDVTECGFFACAFTGRRFYVLLEDSQGFVSAETYPDEASFSARWEELESAALPN